MYYTGILFNTQQVRKKDGVRLHAPNGTIQYPAPLLDNKFMMTPTSSSRPTETIKPAFQDIRGGQPLVLKFL